jgi:hypothetical protein
MSTNRQKWRSNRAHERDSCRSSCAKETYRNKFKEHDGFAHLEADS